MRRPTLAHRVEYLLFRSVTLVLGVLPERVASGVGAALGVVLGRILRIRRDVVEEHVRLAFPDESEAWRRRIVDQSYVHLGREAVVFFRMAGAAPEDIRARTRVVGFEAVKQAAAEGRGIVGITGHLGNWEMSAAAVVAHGVPLDAVAKEMANPLFDRALNDTRRRLGVEVVDMMDAPRRVLGNLRLGGRMQGLLADQNAHRGGIFVPFFGKLAATVRGPAVFAIRTGAPVFMVSAIRDSGPGGGYVVSFDPIEYSVTGDMEADVLALTRAHVSALEGLVRAAPEQYFWVHKRWKKRPEGSPTVDP